MEGVINLRGRTIPVVDLRRRFGLQVTEHRDTRIVVVDVGSQNIRVIVEAVTEVLRVGDEAIEERSAVPDLWSAEASTGIAKLESRLVILLDLAGMLAEAEGPIDGQTGAAAPGDDGAEAEPVGETGDGAE